MTELQIFVKKLKNDKIKYKKKIIDDIVMFNHPTLKGKDQDLNFTGLDGKISKTALKLRGETFHLKTGKLLGGCMPKYFNVGENSCWSTESFQERLRTQKYEILEKVDGSMIIPFIIDGKIHFKTRSAKFKYDATEKEIEGIMYIMSKIGHPIFEFIHKKKKIVVEYSSSIPNIDTKGVLVLLGIRKPDDSFVLYDELLNFEKYFQIVKRYESFGDLSKMKNFEGYIVRFEDGMGYKLKTDWYVRHHIYTANIVDVREKIRRVIKGNAIEKFRDDFDEKLIKEVEEEMEKNEEKIKFLEKLIPVHFFEKGKRHKKAYREWIMSSPTRKKHSGLFQLIKRRQYKKIKAKVLTDLDLSEF